MLCAMNVLNLHIHIYVYLSQGQNILCIRSSVRWADGSMALEGNTPAVADMQWLAGDEGG